MKMHVAPRLAAVATMSLVVGACGADQADSKGLSVQVQLTEEASVGDVGLPEYPGARPYKDPGESSSGANVGLRAGSFGFKVVALEFSSSDGPQKVAAFYREALAKYGDVLECTDGKSSSKRESSGGLACDLDERSSHSIVY